MSESTMRTRVVKLLKKWGLDGQAVENMVGPGMPDIYYIGGWIETKLTRAWPKRATSVVRLDHGLRSTQKLWIRRHTKRGGKVFVLIQIAKEFLLLDGETAVYSLDECTRSELIELATLHCHGWAELEEHLKAHL